MKRRKPAENSRGEQEILDVLGAAITIKSDPAVVNMLVTERIFPPGYATPIHSYEADDELVYVLEGEITVVGEDGERVAGPGTCMALPRHRAHAYRNDSEVAAKGLTISQPGIQTVELFRNLDRASQAARSVGRSLSEKEVAQITDQYGVQVRRPIGSVFG